MDVSLKEEANALPAELEGLRCDAVALREKEDVIALQTELVAARDDVGALQMKAKPTKKTAQTVTEFNQLARRGCCGAGDWRCLAWVARGRRLQPAVGCAGEQAC